MDRFVTCSEHITHQRYQRSFLSHYFSLERGELPSSVCLFLPVSNWTMLPSYGWVAWRNTDGGWELNARKQDSRQHRTLLTLESVAQLEKSQLITPLIFSRSKIITIRKTTQLLFVIVVRIAWRQLLEREKNSSVHRPSSCGTFTHYSTAPYPSDLQEIRRQSLWPLWT